MSAEHRWNGDDVLIGIRERARRLTAAAGVILQDEVKFQLNLHASPPASEAGAPPGKQTGTLGRSVVVGLSGLDDPNPSVEVGPDLRVAPWGRIQELGGTILPKRAKFLAVPLGPQGRRAARQSTGSIRSLNLVLVPRKGKAALLGRRVGQRFTPLFILLSSVTLPARPYMKPAFSLARPRILEMYRREGLVGDR